MSTTPAAACDAHIHINDAASVHGYRAAQAAQGTSRVVIVTPRIHVTDNGTTTGAIAALGMANARGVGVLRPDVTDAQLRALDAAGIRGIRFTVFQPVGQVVTIDMIEPLAKRIAPLGWHVQLHMTADQVVENAAMIARLPSTIVFDHMGRMPLGQGARHPAFGVIGRLIDAGRTWVKLSGPYLDDPDGAPGYGAVTPLARAWVEAAPERLVWGSDWPHPLAKDPKPRGRELIDLLEAWAPDAATRTKILVDNPAQLYGF
jgi:D-galactarolactone isomerase